MTPVMKALLTRSSEPRLQAPAPDDTLLETVFDCAARAPDHALLRPWRYLVIRGESLGALGELFVRAASSPEQPLAIREQKLLDMPQRAPLIIVGIASPKAHASVPEIEQLMSTSVGMGYMLLALQDSGFGAFWRTGPLASHPVVRDGLGLSEQEQIAGFLYVGSVQGYKPTATRPKPAEFVRVWP